MSSPFLISMMEPQHYSMLHIRDSQTWLMIKIIYPGGFFFLMASQKIQSCDLDGTWEIRIFKKLLR